MKHAIAAAGRAADFAGLKAHMAETGEAAAVIHERFLGRA
jgi:hypothetical protein